ncbi:biotin--[acetyl-CoA-carboxylase] ligase [Williamsia sterculiae]|uniref:biotin--[biotin carboxyl-carrier protein] ligase n=1 Tax=Williamsia sterculiae TaxID=1344003 RepID=A0A1N7DZY5_9NOCA|nr:biotin--[acetyl-CoA-carboxylase] ligase [Williamsia sterculiae]SIR81351.1 BirA family transcriptional regulator, biotin operon repressor / biotin-[acetyl-CoA-carboxylase] ligase [Williamsia sterculiae]
MPERLPLDADRLRSEVLDGPRWRELRVVETTGSTNADLAAAVADGDIRDTVLLAETQTAGRGRHDRMWSSPPRAQLAMSVAVDTAGGPARIGWLPLLTGVAVARALSHTTGVGASLKWPNDVLVDADGEPRKVAGILAELVHDGTGPVAVVGIGVNTGLTADELPVPTATSLQLVTGAAIDRDAVATAVLTELADQLSRWPHEVEAVAADYRALCSTVGHRVRVELPGDRELLGIATDVDAEGRMVVRGDDGADHAVAAGDVTHLRRID